MINDHDILSIIRTDDVSFFKDMIDDGLDPNKLVLTNQVPLIFYASGNSAYKILSFLIDVDDIDINAKYKGSNTLFSIIRRSTYNRVISNAIIKLLKNDAELIDSKNNSFEQGMNIWNKKDIQEALCEYRPEHVPDLVKTGVFIYPEIKEKYKHLFSAERAGIL